MNRRLHNGTNFGYETVSRITGRPVAFHDLRSRAETDLARRGLIGRTIYRLKIVPLPAGTVES